MVDYDLVSVELTRVCERCGRVRQIAEFGQNGDSDVCGACQVSHLEPDATKMMQVRDFAKKLAAESRGKQIESPHIAEVNAGMFKRFGGVEGFCNAWYGQMQIAIATKPGQRIVLDQFAELVKLAKAATENRNSAPDVANLTDEELGREMLRMVMAAQDSLQTVVE